MSKYIFDFLVSKIGNEFGAAGLMGNLYVESKLQSVYLEGSYAKKFGMTSQEYTDIFDQLSESEVETFCRDGAGYGLAQWTYWSRKKGLWSYAQQHMKSVGDLDIQLNYLWDEIQKYKKVLPVLKSAKSVREASDVVCLEYEKPQHTEEKYLQNRANYGQKYYEEYAGKLNGKEANGCMNSAAYVDQQIEIIKAKGIPMADQVWETALLCVGWPYIFGDRGEYCTPQHRRNKYSDEHPTIKTKCKNFSGDVGCSGCKWYPGGQKVRAFDCRGFTYWCLLKYGIKIMGAGATSQWNDNSNWDAKGTIDSIPNDKLVCLFYTKKGNPKVMEHTGLGYKGETIECSNGVQHFKTRNVKWTHWALPKGLYSSDGSSIIPPEDTTVKLPTLRKGDKNPYVTVLQTMLLDRGYKLPKYGADGSFGAETESAVKEFQRDWNLTMDGVVGSKTWSLLETTPEKQILYTVTIPHLSKEMADDLLKKYVGTAKAES